MKIVVNKNEDKTLSRKLILYPIVSLCSSRDHRLSFQLPDRHPSNVLFVCTTFLGFSKLLICLQSTLPSCFWNHSSVSPFTALHSFLPFNPHISQTFSPLFLYTALCYRWFFLLLHLFPTYLKQHPSFLPFLPDWGRNSYSFVSALDSNLYQWSKEFLSLLLFARPFMCSFSSRLVCLLSTSPQFV